MDIKCCGIKWRKERNLHLASVNQNNPITLTLQISSSTTELADLRSISVG